MNRHSRVSLVIVVAALVVSATKAERPRVMTTELCGIVTDLTGEPIAEATVSAMYSNFSTSQQTGKQGQWSFGHGTGPQWMKVEDGGYQTLEFDYVDKKNPKSNGADNPAFLTRPNGGTCSTPIYVRLAPLNHKSSMVTLDASKGVHKEKKSK